ncbi:MAG: PASTA domain-containing protein [Oscillospiraceae bacterium]|jgi:stage V sporulation protein D (sporulation-specific penicillin-binding protein)|nr:PASTA domain-containing protein [Oscillospiraceae bacterium]
MLVFVFFGGLVLRLMCIQIIRHQNYKKMAEKQYMTIKPLRPVRGPIFDRHMNVLAKSARVWNVVLSPKDTEASKKGKIAKDLAVLLNEDENRIKKLLEKETYYAVVKRGIEKPLADKIKKYKKDNGVWSIYLEPSSKRYYLRRNFLANVLGFVGNDEVGLDGLELYYDKELGGSDGKSIESTNARGTGMLDSPQKVVSARNGYGLVLTIDSNIQALLERHLNQAIIDNAVADKVTGIIMDINTGEVLAMANKPDFDPNKPFEILDESRREKVQSIEDAEKRKAEISMALSWQWRNKAISDPYEPGSVFKVVTAASALEEGTAQWGDHFSCNGSISAGGGQIRCWKGGGHGGLDFKEALVRSCNPSFVKIGMDLGADNFIKYFRAFGFSERTGIDLPGEAIGIFHSRQTFSPHALAISSIGQTFKVTPMQLLVAAAAAVNGGKLVRPFLVNRLVDADGRTAGSNQCTIKRRVVSPEVSLLIAEACEGVVAEGSGRQAFRRGHRTGGKTGTSEKIDKKENGEVTRFVLSFFCFYPIEKPQLAMLILLDEPHIPDTSAAVAAVPVGGRVLDGLRVLRKEEPMTTDKGALPDRVRVPNFAGKKVKEAKEEISNQHLVCKISGIGATVIAQLPAPGLFVPKDGIVTLITDKEEVALITVPDLVGKSLSDAKKTLRQRNLNYDMKQEKQSPEEEAIITKQTPAAGSKVEPGKVIELEFVYRADVNEH